MPRTIWVKVVDPGAAFYQELVDDTTNEVIIEHVRADTVNGRQVPVPIEVTDTLALRKALSEAVPGSQPPKYRIVALEDKEIKEHLANAEPAVAEAAPKAKSPASKE